MKAKRRVNPPFRKQRVLLFQALFECNENLLGEVLVILIEVVAAFDTERFHATRLKSRTGLAFILGAVDALDDLRIDLFQLNGRIAAASASLAAQPTGTEISKLDWRERPSKLSIMTLLRSVSGSMLNVAGKMSAPKE